MTQQLEKLLVWGYASEMPKQMLVAEQQLLIKAKQMNLLRSIEVMRLNAFKVVEKDPHVKAMRKATKSRNWEKFPMAETVDSIECYLTFIILNLKSILSSSKSNFVESLLKDRSEAGVQQILKTGRLSQCTSLLWFVDLIFALYFDTPCFSLNRVAVSLSYMVDLPIDVLIPITVIRYGAHIPRNTFYCKQVALQLDQSLDQSENVLRIASPVIFLHRRSKIGLEKVEETFEAEFSPNVPIVHEHGPPIVVEVGKGFEVPVPQVKRTVEGQTSNNDLEKLFVALQKIKRAPAELEIDASDETDHISRYPIDQKGFLQIS